MASVRYRAGGWDLRYRDRSGHEHTERFRGGAAKTPPPALLERRVEVEAQLRRDEFVAPELRRETFAVYYQRWAAARTISATRTHTDAQRALKHVLPYWGGWPIGRIRPSDVDDWIAVLSTTLGPQSVRHCYLLFRGPLRRAVRDRIITDPCIDIRLPKLKEISKTFDDVLTATEVDQVVAGFIDDQTRYARLRTNHRYQALVFMGAWLGPRWNEAIGLRRCDLNLSRSEITFGRVVINQNGSHTFPKTGSKTGDWRTIPVPGPVIDTLQAHLARYCPDLGREDLIFTNNRGRPILRGNFTRDALTPATTRAGLHDRHHPRRPPRPPHHLAHPPTHRRLPHVRRRPHTLRSPTPPRPQITHPHRPHLHPPHARTLRRRQTTPRDLHEPKTQP